MDSVFLIVLVAMVAAVPVMVIVAAVRPSRPGRHKGAYIFLPRTARLTQARQITAQPGKLMDLARKGSPSWSDRESGT